MSATTRMPVTVGAHLYPDTAIRSKVYPGENRVTVTVEGASITSVTLFADRGELVRLRDAFTQVLVELDEQRAQLAEQGESGTVAA